MELLTFIGAFYAAGIIANIPFLIYCYIRDGICDGIDVGNWQYTAMSLVILLMSWYSFCIAVYTFSTEYWNNQP